MIEFFKQQLESNDFLSGGFTLMLIGAALTYLRYVPLKILKFLKNRMVYTMTIDKARSGADVYHLFNRWLSELESFKNKRNYHYIGFEFENTIGGKTFNSSESLVGKKIKNHKAYLAPGYYVCKYNKKWLLVNITRTKQDTGFDTHQGGPVFHDYVSVSYFAINKKKAHKFFTDIIEKQEYKELSENKDSVSINVADYSNWSHRKYKRKRGMDSLVYEPEMKKDLVDDIDWFFNNKEWYVQNGIPYRRGYLLYGEPGNGKTSIIHAIASHYNKPVYFMSLNVMTSDAQISDLLSNVPDQNAIVVIEDIDCVFDTKTIKRDAFDFEETALSHNNIKYVKDKKNGGLLSSKKAEKMERQSLLGISLSGLLNALDGFLTPENGTILFMTTNYKDKLDPALMRPGRIDRQFYISNANKYRIEEMFKRFFPDSNGHAKEFAKKIGEYQYSMADLQGFFMRFRNPDEAIKNYALVAEEHKYRNQGVENESVNT